MNRQEKLKYNKYKNVVKTWECEFKTLHGNLPNKDDIKSAPKKVIDAYKAYWQLRKQCSDNTILDVTIDENAKDCFNAASGEYSGGSDSTIALNVVGSRFSQALESVNTENGELNVQIPVILESAVTTANSDYNGSDVICTVVNEDEKTSQEIGENKNVEITSDKDLSSGVCENKADTDLTPHCNKENADKSEVWGPHVSKQSKVKKFREKSVSFHYTEKLFAGAKFAKRNPRKPCNFKRNRTSDGIPMNENSLTQTCIDSSVSNISFQGDTSDLNDDGDNNKSKENEIHSPGHFNLLNEKTRVIINYAPPASYQGVSVLQKMMNDGEVTKVTRKVNEGWLERVSGSTKKDENSFVDSGFDFKDSSTSKSSGSTNNALSENQSKDDHDDSGEDLVYNSDTESNTCSQFALRLCKANIETYERNSTSVNQETKDSSRNIKRPLDNPNNKSSKVFRLDSEVDKTNLLSSIASCGKNKLNQPNKLTKTDSHSMENESENNSIIINKCIKELKTESESDKKMRELEKRVSSGKANQNFRKINIEKKVFVRGKKGFNFSRYKKKQWKMLKTANGDSGDLDSGVLKCFKCGDVGHFARQCKKIGDLLPYDEDVDEESIFPTLAEAEEMAHETAKHMLVSRRLRQSENLEVQGECISEQVTSIQPTEGEKERVPPVYPLSDDGSLIETPKEVFNILKDFGFDKFRDGQEEAIMRILSGQSILLSLATGSGKSLCYQIPAYLYYKMYSAVTLVVSPLVSLMEDQVSCCGGKIQMACLHRNQTDRKRASVIEKLKSNELCVLLVSPEALTSDYSSSSLFSSIGKVAFVCVDEAHCLSHWSHNFRPSYLVVCKILREKLNVGTLVGLTATVSAFTCERILSILGAEHHISAANQIPDNLVLSVSKDSNRQRALITLLSSQRFSQCSSIIIYCTKRTECENLASFLRANMQNLNKSSNLRRKRLSGDAEVYHAGLTAGRRKQVQKAFMSGKLRIVVATVAFGMGINKNDVRGVIHYNMPSSFENYVQEIGRAGRDGQPAHCHLFLDHKNDINELKRHIYSNSVDRATLRQLLALVFVNCKCKTTCPRHEIAFSVDDTVMKLDLPQENISTLLSYLEVNSAVNITSVSPAYTTCKISSYKGPRYLAATAKNCPPLALGIALAKHQGAKVQASVEFDVIKVASMINWDSGIVKGTLKKLEWQKGESSWFKTGISVELSDLGFRLLAPGNLSCDEMDEALNTLHSTVTQHESFSLKQLHFLSNTLLSVAYKSVEDCGDSVDLVKCEKLTAYIKQYFSEKDVLKDVVVEKTMIDNEEEVASDICSIINLYPDNSFNGRSIARIFHGIGSPNFPAVVWGRTTFWRLHLDKDFNCLCRLATKQLISFR